MPDSNRYRYGETSPVVAAIATAMPVSIGDIVGLSSNTLVKASDTTWDTNLATTQTAFALLFLGVAAQRKAANVASPGTGGGPDNRVRVDTTGIFEFDCASADFEVGQLVGPAKASGNALEDQKVVGVASVALAIGRVVEKKASATTIRVKIFSNIMDGGPNS